jgi:hypothetical protein
MQTVTTIGLDIAKSVFQVHDVDAVDSGMLSILTSLSPRLRQQQATTDLGETVR